MRSDDICIISHEKVGLITAGAKLHSPAKMTVSFKLLQVEMGQLADGRSQEDSRWECFLLSIVEHNKTSHRRWWKEPDHTDARWDTGLEHTWQKHTNKATKGTIRGPCIFSSSTINRLSNQCTALPDFTKGGCKAHRTMFLLSHTMSPERGKEKTHGANHWKI